MSPRPRNPDVTFRQALAAPATSYASIIDVDADDLDTLQTKILLDYKQGRYQQALKRYENLLATQGFEAGVALINQPEALSEEQASLLIFELLFFLKANTNLTEAQLWKYVDSVSLFDPDDIVCHGAIYNLMLVFFLRSGSIAAAGELAKLSLEAYRRCDSAYLQMFVHLHMAYIHVYAGRLDDANVALDQAQEQLQLCGAPVCENAMIQITRHWVHAEAHNILPSSQTLMPLGEEITSGEFWPETFLVLAALQFRVAKSEGNSRVLEQHSAYEFTLRSRGSVQLLPAMQLLREECLLKNQPPATGRLLNLSERQVVLLLPTVETWRLNVGEATDHTPKLGRMRAVNGLHLAKLWLKRGRFDVAMDHFKSALGIIEQQDWHFLLASEHDFVASMCKECRRRGRFVNWARGVQNTLLAGKNLTRPDAGPVAMMGFTATELGILRRLSNSTSNKALAIDFGVSESTIKYHLKNIYRKLSVHSRRDAIDAAAGLGLI